MPLERNGFKWTINEIMTLQRENELLGLSAIEIASNHKRSVRAIVSKLEAEGFCNNNQTEDVNDRVWSLETIGQRVAVSPRRLRSY